MAFVWEKKNKVCSSRGGQRLSSVSAPLLVQTSNRVWLVTRSTASGHLEAYCGDGEAADGWVGQRDALLDKVRTGDSPGGAASSDGQTLLLVYRGFWRHHLLWCLWRAGHWYGNLPIENGDQKQRLVCNGRGPAVLFCKQRYWVFYVDEEQQLSSSSFARVDIESGQPLWEPVRAYDCVPVHDGRPCAVVVPGSEDSITSCSSDQLIHVYYHSIRGLACMALDQEGNALCFYSYSQLGMEVLCGTPTLVLFKRLHLFYRTPKNQLCWYLAHQSHSWTQASCAETLNMDASHAAAAIVSQGQLTLLCTTHPNPLQEIQGQERPALRLSRLEFHRL